MYKLVTGLVVLNSSAAKEQFQKNKLSKCLGHSYSTIKHESLLVLDLLVYKKLNPLFKLGMVGLTCIKKKF